MKSQEDTAPDKDGLPPFVASWKQLYMVMLGALVAQIVLFYVFMQYFQ